MSSYDHKLVIDNPEIYVKRMLHVWLIKNGWGFLKIDEVTGLSNIER